MALVCLGALPWGRSWKRIQSMSHQLAHLPPFERLVFVNPRDSWVTDLLLRGEGNAWDRLRALAALRPRRHGPRVHILDMVHWLPLLGRWRVGREAESALFRRFLRASIGGRPYVLLNNHPRFFDQDLLEELMEGAALNAFDISDDFVEYYEQEEVRRLYWDNLEFCCSRSDLVFAVNEHVAAKYGEFNAHTHVIRNATNVPNFDRQHYRTVGFLRDRRREGQPLLGYTGIINRVRVDYELLEHLLRERPHWQFVFVGSADRSFLELVESHPNLHHHPAVGYDWLPDWLAPMDVNIVPFRVNEHTRGNDLLKVYDYLATGKRVVCTDTAGVRRCAEFVRIADGPEAFLEAVEAALAEDDGPDARRARQEFARRHFSWEQRSREVHGLLMQRLRDRVAGHESPA